VKLVLVSWLDIMNWSGWNDDLIKDGKDEPKLFHTIGFEVKRTKTKLTISDSWPDIGAVTTFPMGCVQEITEIKIASGISKRIRNRETD